MEGRKPFACPGCANTFYVKDPQKPEGSRTPLLLGCGHTVCEGCLTTQVRQGKDVFTCPICQRETNKGTDGLGTKGLPVDLYRLGVLATRKLQDRRKLLHLATAHCQKSKPLRVNIPVKGRRYKKLCFGDTLHQLSLRVDGKSEKCIECTKRDATCRCLKCDCKMCGQCFDKIHQNSKALMRHQAVPLYEEESNEPVTPVTCEEHENRPIEYFCEDDKVAICSHCVIKGVHKGHNISSMEEKNKDALLLLEPAINAATVIKHRLNRSYKVLDSAQVVIEEDMMKAAEKIQLEFSGLHAALQVREQMLLEELLSQNIKESEAVLAMKSNVEEIRKKVNQAVREGKKLLSVDNQLLLNAKHVLERLQQAEKELCIASPVEDFEPVSVKFDDLHDQVLALGTTVGSAKPRFVLKKQDEVTEDHVPENGEEDDTASNADSTSFLSVLDWASQVSQEEEGTLASSVTDTMSVTSDTSSTTETNHKKKFSLRLSKVNHSRSTPVFVTHIKNPCSFMVQKFEDQNRLRTMAQGINRWCESSDANKHIPTSLEEGDLVLVKYSQDQTWYRGRVQSVISSPSASGDTVLKAKINYLDYGNSEVVTFDRMRISPKKFLRVHQLSIKCSLQSIAPKGKTEWTMEAASEFAKVTGDNVLLMNVIEEKDGVLYVDLTRPGSEDIDNDRPISVTEALVFLEVACFVSEYSVPSAPGGTLPTLKRQYLKPSPHKKGEEFPVLISHINSPGDFYVQKAGEDMPYLTSLMTKLRETYKEDTKDMWSIYCPVKGMICVAQHSRDSLWYRAKVMDLPGGRLTKLQYVDHGSTDIVSHYNLKKLLNQFLVLPPQAIHCSLAHIEPKDKEQGWTESAKELLTEYMGKTLWVRVAESGDGEQKLPVMLFNVDTEINNCINKQLVMTDNVTALPSLVDSALEVPKIQKREKALSKKINKQTNAKKKLASTVTATPATPAAPETAEPAIPTAKAQTKDKPMLAEVIVTHMESPGLIYAQLPSAGSDGLDQLMKDLQEYYPDSQPVDIQWKEDDTCAALFSQDQNWYRARLLHLTEDKKAEVLLMDYGFRDTVPVTDLRTLDTKYQVKPCFALRCYLADIQPAGDTSKWSSTACEFLDEEVHGKVLNVVQKGNVGVMKIVPVDLLREEKIPGEALTADRIEHKSISRMLVDKGLALPVRRRPKSSDGTPSSPEEPVPPVTLAAGRTKVHLPKLVGVNDDPTKKSSCLIKKPPDSIKKEIGVVPPDGTSVDPPEVGKDTQPHQEPSHNPEALKEDQVVCFPPPNVPDSMLLKVVPTYVDYNCVIYAQEIKDQQHSEGRFGFLLKETTLEITIQNQYLDKFGLHRCLIPRDGNCLFRTVAQALLGDMNKHEEVRQKAVETLGDNWSHFEPMIVEKSKDDYLKDLSHLGTYGGEIEIHILCWAYQMCAEVYFGGLMHPVKLREYGNPQDQKVRMIYVSDGFHDNGHYDLVLKQFAPKAAKEAYKAWRGEWIESFKRSAGQQDESVYEDSVLEQLHQLLLTHYENTQPEDVEWRPGEACVGQFSDSSWYRGRVTEVNPEKGVKVFYLDFGNSDYVDPFRLRKPTILSEVPQQCYECELTGIKPKTHDGKWPIWVLDEIHRLIVGNSCLLGLKKPAVYREHLQVSLLLPNERDLAELLCETGLAMPEDQDLSPDIARTVSPLPVPDLPQQVPVTSSVLPPSVEEPAPTGVSFRREWKSPYRPLQLPEPGVETLVTVTQVDSTSMVYIQLVKQDQPVGDYLVKMCEQLDSLLDMMEHISQDATSYLPLTDPKPGDVCCSQYTLDDCWYRGEVVDVSSDASGKHIGVLYVDYGNSEYVSLDRLRVLPDELRPLPAQAAQCCIMGLQPASSAVTGEALLALNMAFSEPVIMCVREPGDPTIVELYKQNPGTSEQPAIYAYQMLIDQGLAVICSNSQDSVIEEVCEENDTKDVISTGVVKEEG